MKKRLLIIIALILILTALTFAGCDKGGGSNPDPDVPPTPTPQEVVKVVAKQETVSIHEKEFADFNYTSLFIITVDDKQVLIQQAYLDLSHLPKNVGEEGYVVCEYKGESARCNITITPITYELTLSANEISITQLQVDDGYDYLALFHATEDGETRKITDDMVKNDVKREVGDYTYSVTYQGVTKTLTVHVTEAHRVEVVNSYRLLRLQIEQLENLDVTTLFSIYLDGETVKVTEDMIDASALENAQVGQEYDVVLTYVYKDARASSTAKIKIVPPKDVVVNARNAVIFPNGGNLDVKTLFTIKEGDEYVTVTDDMITGSIDYSAEGSNEITLTYKGKSATAIVEVRRGVVITLPKGDTIAVKKGTNKTEYNFANDVAVSVNGTRFTFVTYGDGTAYHIDTTGVDFSTAGIYTATVSIPYTDSSKSTTYTTATINYVVKETTYELSVLQSEVLLAQGTTSYSLAKNISVKVNGITKVVVFDKTVAESDFLTVYAKLLTDPIDFNLVGTQHVKMEVYAGGMDEEPEIVEFDVRIKSNVKVTAYGKVVFVGKTVYTLDLFSVKDGDKDIKVTADMLEGKVDTYTPGVYSVKIDYLGVEATAKVLVLSDDIVGTYKTNMTTIPSEISKDYGSWEENDGWGDYGDSDTDDEVKPIVPLKDMTISADGTIVVNGTMAQVVDGVDQSTIIISLGSENYTLYINDGIVVIDPDNSNRLSFTDARRPLVYFSKTIWNLKSRVVVNSSSNYVLSTTNTAYSIDTFKIENKQTGQTRWYGLYTRLVSRSSADTVYNVSWGEASYPDDFVPKANATSVLTFGGQQYEFVMSTSVTAKIQTTEQAQKYSGTYKGSIDGDDSARLTVDAVGNYKLSLNGKTLFSASKSEISGMVNGGVNTDDDILYFYNYKTSYYSYKIIINNEAKTFEAIKKDGLFGYYEFDNRFIFLDGYGKGFAKLDKTSYTEVKVEYERNANEVTLRFIDAPYDYEYGQEATFVVSTFGNVLSVKYVEGDKLAGADFVNSRIESGAIVTIGQTTFDRGTSTIVNQAILNSIKIVTKQGTLTDAEKKKCVDLSAVVVNKAGFYSLPITLDLNGESVTAYYAIQIVAPIDGANKTFKAEYGNGLINNSISLNIDNYSQLTLVCGSVTYKGFVSASDTEFYSRAYDSNGNVLDVQGGWLTDGIVFVRASGAVIVNEYFAKGTVSTAGGNGAVLRKMEYDGKITYLYSASVASQVEIISDIQTLEGNGTENGAIVKFVVKGKEIIAKIVQWGSASGGLLINDGYRGTYTCAGQDNLVVDGFGNLSIGTIIGTYTFNANGSLLVKTSTDMFVLDVSVMNGTYKPSSIKLDASLVRGKTFSAEYYFACPSDETSRYLAQTQFIFLADGKVSVISVSTEHDSGEDQCPQDTYKPSFASKNGLLGEYQVIGNTLKVTVGGATFTFAISDVSLADTLVCTSTTLDQSTSQGAFKVGEKFSV